MESKRQTCRESMKLPLEDPDARLVRDLGLVGYGPTWEAMRRLTESRGAGRSDELWLLEHRPVYTLGLSGRSEHVLDPGPIPVVRSDRGGQITYHGPGQLVIYVLLDLRRMGIGVRRLVHALEQAVIDLCALASVGASRRPGAPGVYIEGRKVAALGLRVKRGCSYHGLALNVDMDLTPYQGINPCGYPGLPVTQLRSHGFSGGIDPVKRQLLPLVAKELDACSSGHSARDLSSEPRMAHT
jgi:lipoyl(octanoyl) transferase